MDKHDMYYKQIEKVTRDFNSKRRVVERDSDLSATGRNKRIAELKAELEKEVTRVQESFSKAIEDKEKSLQESITSKDSRKDFLNKNRDKLFSKLLDEFRLLGDVTVNSDSLSFLALEDSINGLRSDLRSDLGRFIFVTQTAGLDAERIKTMANTLYRQGDVTKLEMLREAATFKDDELLIPAIEGYINDIRQKSLSPGQRLAQEELQLLEKEKTLFNFTVSNAITRGLFVDARQIEEGNETVLHISPDSFIEQDKLAKIARENPEEYQRLRRENRLEEALEEYQKGQEAEKKK